VRPLRFCHVTTFYPPYNFGGDGIAIRRLSEALVRRGHDVTVIHDKDAFDSLNPGDDPSPPTDGAISRIGLESRSSSVSSLLTHQLGRPVVHRRRLAELLDGDGFDVINFHNVSLVGGPGVLGLGDAVKFYTAHEHWLVCPTHVLWRHDREPCDARECVRCVLRHRRPPQLWRATSLLDRSLDHIDTFIALSEFSRRKHAEFGFTRPMEVLPCFVEPPDVEANRQSPNTGHADEDGDENTRPFVLYAGRLERLKGLDDVIPQFGSDLGVDLVIAGDGTHDDELRRLAADLPAVRFVGWVDRPQLNDLYARALAVVVPTVGYETFGQTVIEAFSHGAPVIARRTGPLPELIEKGGGGELFDDASELRDIVTRLATDEAVRRSYSGRALESFRSEYCEDVVVPRYLALVERALERRRARSARPPQPSGSSGVA
jgi:glycosyltransferase involved in cell wall biosynthesis